MIIPYQKIPAETLRALIEDFITREGTDYGAIEMDLSKKVLQVQQSIERAQVVVVFDEASETTNLLSAEDAKSLL